MQSDDRDLTQPTEHERRVAEEVDERRGRKEGPLGHDDALTYPDAERAGEGSTYDREVEAERRGTTAEELGEDEGSPLDSAYKPRTG